MAPVWCVGVTNCVAGIRSGNLAPQRTLRGGGALGELLFPPQSRAYGNKVSKSFLVLFIHKKNQLALPNQARQALNSERVALRAKPRDHPVRAT